MLSKFSEWLVNHTEELVIGGYIENSDEYHDSLFDPYHGSLLETNARICYKIIKPPNRPRSKNPNDNYLYIYPTTYKNTVDLEWGWIKVKKAKIEICSKSLDGMDSRLIHHPDKTVLSINKDDVSLVKLVKIVMVIGDNYGQLSLIRLGFLDYIPFDVVLEILMDYMMINVSNYF